MLPAFHLVSVTHDEQEKKTTVWSCLIPRFVSLCVMGIMALLVLQSIGGFTFYQPSLFGWHVLGMSIFAVIGNSESVLELHNPLLQCGYGNHMDKNKLCNVFIQFLSVICATLGMVSIIYYQNSSMSYSTILTYNVYSAHSWLGILAILSWLSTFFIKKCLSSYKTVHTYLTNATYVFGLSACAVGLQEAQTINTLIPYILPNQTYTLPMTMISTDSWWSIEANIAIVLLACSGFVTLWNSMA